MSTYAFDLANSVVFDVEVYPDHWCVGFYGPNAETGELTSLIVEDRERLAKVLDHLARTGKTLLGYNSGHYDIPVTKGILAGFNPYPISRWIIDHEGEPPPALRKLPELANDHVDLCARVQRGKRFMSLKLLAAQLGQPTLAELPYPPDDLLTDEEWAEVVAYNKIDLANTWRVAEVFTPELAALAALSNRLGDDLRSTPIPRVCERVFTTAYRNATGCDPQPPEVPSHVTYRPVAGVTRPTTEDAAAWYDLVVNTMIPMIAGKDDRLKPEVPTRDVNVYGLKLRLGKGGIHSKDSPTVHYATKHHALIVADVASYYPHLIATKAISPRAYGDRVAKVYRELLAERLRLKGLAKSATSDEERRVYEVQATALKLVLNSTFGKFGDEFSSLFDPGAMLAVTLSGQLMLVDLCERLTQAGVEVLSVNTDGLYARVTRGDDSYRTILAEWERDTAMTLEVESIERLAIRATNIYATLDDSGHVKRKGAGFREGFGAGASPNNLVIGDAVAAALLFDVPPEVTIGECRDPAKFCSVTRRTGAVLAGVLRDDATGDEVPTGKVTRWYRAKGSSRRIIHHFEGHRHTTPPGAQGIQLAANLGDALPDDLDIGWYIGQARTIIQSIPGYRHCTRKRLQGHEAASNLVDRGLSPVPMRGKTLLPGKIVKQPSWLYQWDQYPTIGTKTGPHEDVGILAIDVDDPETFRGWLNHGVTKQLPGLEPWLELAASLVVVHGIAAPEAARNGLVRTKFLFRFPGDDPRAERLARVKQDRWLKQRGFEIFYGKGSPAVAGEHPDGTRYTLHGELTTAPDWLIDQLIPPKRIGAKNPRVDRTGDGIQPSAEQLDQLLARLAMLDPDLGTRPGWRPKKLDKHRTVWVGRCPYEHESGRSSDGDLMAGFDPEGLPFLKCQHSTCEQSRLISTMLRDASRPIGESVEPTGPIELSDIGRSMFDDLARKRVALHRAEPGAGKTYGAIECVAERYRHNRPTLLALPTVRLCQEAEAKLAELIPDAFAAQAVATIYGLGLPPSDEATEADEAIEANDCGGRYPIHEWTQIVICTATQLGRRGFSKYLRGIWPTLEPQESKEGDPIRNAFAMIVDEAGDFLARCRQDIPLEHRTKGRGNPDGSGGVIIPLIDCPKATHSGNCGNCQHHDHYGSTAYNRYAIRELRPPGIIETKAGVPLRTPLNPLKVGSDELTLGERIHCGDTTWAATVAAFRGVPVRESTRWTAPLYVFQRDRESGGQVPEEPTEVLGHMLEFANRPIITWEHPIDPDGAGVDVAELKAAIGAGAKDWDKGVTFPLATCGVARLRFTDLMALEKIRRFARECQVGVIFTGAGLSLDDVATLAEVWPDDLVVRIHPAPDRRIRQAALAFLDGYSGSGVLHTDDRRLTTHPLEDTGPGVVFLPRKRVAWDLYRHVAAHEPHMRLVVENDEGRVIAFKSIHAGPGEPITTLTYSRGVLGLGVNLVGLRYVVVDAKAFRALASFTPGDISPEEFQRMRTEERLNLLIQNLGRLIRGDEGQTVVLFVINADPDLRQGLIISNLLQQGCELPPVVGTGLDFGQLVDSAKRWLEAGGGDWPEVDATKAKQRKEPKRGDQRKVTKPLGRKPGKTREDIMAGADEAIRNGLKWTDFRRKQNPQRYLPEDEVAALKERFKNGASNGE